ncbi:TetR family transcriptional regulator [Streptomyces sp. WAC 01529]|uniref:TetR/AcrR family transcriptional regulator n=1 Tax=Streptomyces sp. WAC 01529 TaxID=2203205 RepID=UPI000F71A5BB|nr:TetR/AcrR family transcriptional regulator [Streptomyces sp. WAC 01529]AZM55577.1 TetR family transcriptional regulator [Streptomyces sp. WAC 01529]
MNLDDPRAQRSRARLRTAILELVAAKDPASITMSEVAKHAGVNRATLYQHFPDVNALVTDALEETVAHVARAAALCPREAPRDDAPQPLYELFQHIAESAALYRRMLGTQGSALFAARMRERLTAELVASFQEQRRPAGFDDVPAEVHAAYLAGALIGVIATWVDDDAPAPAEETALAFWRLFRN